MSPKSFFNVTVKVSGQTGVTVPFGAKLILICNGTDVVQAVNYMYSPTFSNATLVSSALGAPISGNLANVKCELLIIIHCEVNLAAST